jgi:hypothetical protein
VSRIENPTHLRVFTIFREHDPDTSPSPSPSSVRPSSVIRRLSHLALDEYITLCIDF